MMMMMIIIMFQPSVVIIRPSKYIKTKITFATSIVGGQIGISTFGVTKCIIIIIIIIIIISVKHEVLRHKNTTHRDG